MVSIIIVNYNGGHLLNKCLESIRQLKILKTEYEVIIVDNNSSDNSLSLINKYSKEFKLVELSSNRGFAGGNIEGLKYAQGDYIILLNNDTEVDNNWLENLIKPFEKEAQIGICASKMIVYGTEIIDSAGDGCTNIGRGFKLGDGQHSSQYNESKYVFGACGGAVAYRRKMLDEIGFLDDDFFLIYEDTDVNMRAQLMGWKCMFVHDAIVYHKVRSTIGNMSDLSVYYSVRNAEYVWLKNMPLKLILKYFPHKVMQEIAMVFYFCIKHKQWKMYLKAKYDFFKNTPQLIRKRKLIQKKRKVSDNYLDSILVNIFAKDFFREKIKKLLK